MKRAQRLHVGNARRHFGSPDVVIGIWRERDPLISRSLKRSSRADEVVATVAGVLAAAITAATTDPAKGLRPAHAARPRLVAAAE